jgi:two-component system chemotaxis response regulator CheB
LPACYAAPGDPIRWGRIHLALPGHHLVLDGGRIGLASTPAEHGVRPAADPLFRSAALAYGPRVVGVVLTGTLDDGTAGLATIRQRGGVTIVQDPDEAQYSGMPRSALESLAIDHTLPMAGIAQLLGRLARDPIVKPKEAATPDDMDSEARMSAFDLGAMEQGDRPGRTSGFACPDCGETLWKLQDGELVRFRCRVGHAWSANGLIAEQSNGIETALWTALRALEERAALCTRVADRMSARGLGGSAERFHELAVDSRDHAETLRRALLAEPSATDEPRASAGPAPHSQENGPREGRPDE